MLGKIHVENNTQTKHILGDTFSFMFPDERSGILNVSGSNSNLKQLLEIKQLKKTMVMSSS